MDLSRAIKELYAEKEKLERTIMLLEQLEHGNNSSSPSVTKGTSTRGRKSMSSEERKEVSERMKKYWSERRSGAKA